ncbi:sugar ABC transporter permease [Sporanaerobium hydrogeniformans]|uniref:Sugar ABC transporter permease n=1 Tax=Sporanaerobium hydrogeniformans TaxID=3072179 RepID=A0AC61D8W8_9FIRM|nr:sugar ABC transporter permease [Sporanaerobium hydrogeniformans]PHV69674.1 sugar ABC transporter permease [Sporanaerobium hydrogeniformans]
MELRLQKKQRKQLHKEPKHISQNKPKSDLKIALCFILPSLIGVGIFILIPFLDVIRRSFCGAMNGQFVGANNYITVFNNEAFKLASKNTIKFIVVCIPLLIVISLALALLVNSLKKKNEIFKSMFLLPMAIPVASVVLLWQVIFNKNGLLSAGIEKLGMAPIDWMNSDWAFWILVASYLWRNVGYNMVFWLAGLTTLSESVDEAAMVDGANGWQRLTRITLPQLIPNLFTITVLSLLNSFKVFREAYLIAGQYPHDSMYMLQHLFNNWFMSLDIDKLSAAATVVASVILVLILFLQKTWESED